MYTMNRIYWEYYAELREENPKKAKFFRSNFLKTKSTLCENSWKVFYSDDGENLFQKRFFPYHFTPEEEVEYIENSWQYIDSWYDCTGKWFTTDIKFFKVENGTWIYHWKSIDI